MTQKQLQQIAEEAEGLRKATAEIVLGELESYDNAEDFFNDLFSHGCVSGLVGSLIYYTDTHAFAKEHLEDIMTLYQEVTEELGVTPSIDSDATNWLAWFGFEETALQLYHEIGGENW